MNYYQETLDQAKKLISGSALSAEDKTLLSDLIPRMSLDMLEIFVWTIEEDPSNTSAIVEKTRRLISSATDSVELKKALDADKKEMERVMAEEEMLKAASMPEPV
ncbi:MAG: hypothetical protein WCT49_00405 [Candidatus Paceibacterota bacterium]|jgi:hypothetical protein|nr:hypothetical protein [Candidatus Paceibacterota bacterium]